MSGPSTAQLFDLVVEENLVPSEYFVQWDEFAQWQFETLRRLGLSPHHQLLDIGCGALRLGSLAIPYLDDDHYCGIDPFEPFHRIGRRILADLGVEKRYALHCSGSFDFEVFDRRFDYAIAQSVFTHLSEEAITGCVTNLAAVMAPGGQLVFTYTLQAPTARRGILYSGTTPMQVPVISDDAFFAQLASGVGAAFERRPDLAHPTQDCGVLRFPGPPTRQLPDR